MIKEMISLLSLVFFCFTLNAQSQPTKDWSFNDEISLWKKHETLKNAGIGIFVQDATTGEVLAKTEPQLSLAPASTMKLVTTATALEILGSDFRFETQLAYSGEIKNDTLYGNLVIIGGGDPALGSEYFKEHYLENHFLDQWTKELQALPIKHITGDIITDATIFEEQTIPNTWIWEDLGNYYGAGACGLSVYDNMYRIHMTSPAEAGQPTRVLTTKPFIPELELDNQVKSSKIKRDLAYVYGAPMSNQRTIRGTIPLGQANFVIKASVPNPPFLLGWELLDRITSAQITVDGFIKSQGYNDTLPKLTLVSRTLSPTLLEIATVTNYESVNLFAEHLLKYLAFLMNGEGSTKKGTQAITDFWEKHGIDTHGFFMADGSGLSHFNALTAEQMVGILHYMKNQSVEGSNWFSSIPCVPNGTLYYFNPVNFPNNSLRAKSGSMTRVRCYAGELTTQNGQPLLFAVFLNNFDSSHREAIRLIEDLLLRFSKSK